MFQIIKYIGYLGGIHAKIEARKFHMLRKLKNTLNLKSRLQCISYLRVEMIWEGGGVMNTLHKVLKIRICKIRD